MTSKMIILFCVLLLTLAGFIGAAGNYHWWTKASALSARNLPSPGDEYRKIMEQFNGHDSAIDLSGTIKIYDKEDQEALKETSTFRLIRSGRQYFMQLSYLQTFCNGSVILQLDTVNKLIVIAKAGDEHSSMDFQKGRNPGLLFNDTAQFRISGEVYERNTERKLRLQSDFNPEIRSYSLIYDTLSYRVHRAEIEWWKNSMVIGDTSTRKIWLTKINYQYQPCIGLNMDEGINKIIDMSGGEAHPRKMYNDYKINANF